MPEEISVEGKRAWKCSICGTVYTQHKKWAEKCEENHTTVYIKMNREDLFKLLQFIITKDDSLLSESLIKTLYKYSSGAYV